MPTGDPRDYSSPLWWGCPIYSSPQSHEIEELKNKISRLEKQIDFLFGELRRFSNSLIRMADK